MMEDIVSLSSWDMVKKDTPIAIAGPCSAESEEQLLGTCAEINKHIDIYIMGIDHGSS